GAENIRPKSIARDMVERFCTFNDYIRDYGLQRSEGVLLRYLSEVYKTLLQTVPESMRTEEVEDLIAQMRVMLRAVDSSLLDEWERMRDPERAKVIAPEEVKLGSLQTVDPTKDLKRFTARVRAELHRLLKAVATKDWEEATAAIFQQKEGEWTHEQLEAEMAPYFEAHGAVDLTPRARQPIHTILREEGPRTWRAQQRIFDSQGEGGDWMLDCVIDLTVARNADAPLISLQRIGT
ncbi:MAG: DUF3516 domain-containing protein, partial [Myxococcaceae bacterium]